MKIVLAKMQDSSAGLQLAAAQYPLNISYLAQVCIDAGYEVEMWDFCIEPFTEEYLTEKIKKSKPDVLGISCVTSSIYYGHTLATVAKQVNDEILTVIGGVHVTALPEETMDDFPCFDVGVLTEGEETILDICAEVEKKNRPIDVRGTIARDNDGNIRRMLPRASFPDVNDIPFPNRKLLPMDWYTQKHSTRGVTRKAWNIIEVDSSRGCPFACTFCNVELTHGRKVRFRTPENMLAEIEQCVKAFGSDFVVFNDSTFTTRKDRAMEIVKGLPKIGIKGYSVNAHVNTIDAELMETLAKTGCYKIMFGVESGSDRVLRVIKKNATQERIRNAFDLAHRYNIPQIEGTFILGADIDETHEDMLQTEQLIKEIRPDILGVGIITPFPGTSQFVEMQERGYFENVSWDQFQIFSETPPPWRIANFSAEELVARRNRILKSYIWTPRYVGRQLSKVRSIGELSYYASMARSFYDVVVRKAS